MRRRSLYELSPDENKAQLQVLSLIILFMIAVPGALALLSEPDMYPVYDINLFAETIRQSLNATLFLLGVFILLARVPLSNFLFGKALDKEKPTTLARIYPLYCPIFFLRVLSAGAAAAIGFTVTSKSGEISSYVVLAVPAAISIIKDFPTHKKIRDKIKLIRPRLQILD